jgi:phage N-6-adenine-methyltransferase
VFDTALRARINHPPRKGLPQSAASGLLSRLSQVNTDRKVIKMTTRTAVRQLENAAIAHESAAKPKISKVNRGMFTGGSDEWETPQEFFNVLNAKYSFTLDVCAAPLNAKCGRYYTKTEDGLSQPWYGVCWMNPPYGREIVRWVRKAYESSLGAGTVVVCLLPARTDTQWWHEYVAAHAGQVEFIRGRLKFGKGGAAKNSAPFPSALVVFGDFKPRCGKAAQ